MSVEELRPDTTVALGGGSVTGAGSAHAALSDDNASSYLIPASPATTVAFPASADLAVSYTIEIVASDGPATIELETNGDEPVTLRTSITRSGEGTRQYVPPALPPEAFDPAEPRISIDTLTAFAVPRIREFYLHATSVDTGTVTITAPTGTLTTTNAPLVEWDPTLDSDGGQQTSYEVVITDDSGFDPDIDTGLVESGVLAGNETEWQVDDALANDTYYAHVRIAQTINNETVWTAWDSQTFAVNTAALGEPTLTLTPEGDAYRMRIDVTPHSLMTQYGFEDDGSQVTNTGTGTTDRRTTALYGQNAQQGLWMRESDLTGAATDAGAIGATIDTAVATHKLAVWVLADHGVAAKVLLDERSSGATLDTTTVAWTGDRTWQRITATNAFSAGIRVRYRITVNAAVETAFAHDGVQLVGAGAELADAFQIQKRQTGTDDWLDLRTPSGGGLISDAETAYDAEAANGVAMEYRARAVHVSSATENIYSDWVAASDFVTWDTWTVKHPYQPGLNTAVTVRSQPSRSRTIASGVQRVLGRASPVVIYDARYCWEGEIVFRCDNDDDRVRLQNITADGSPLLIQAPASQYWQSTWVAFTDAWEQTRVIDIGWEPMSFDSFKWVQVQRPTAAMAEWPSYFVETEEED